ncbi:MAG: acyl CoA:acetate/3-ketoacid CoA transferase [Clostridia bacterium]
MGPEVVEAGEIAARIPDGAHVLTVGMTLAGASESILTAIESRFLAEGHPHALTLIHSAGQSNRQDGIQHLAHEGLVHRIIGSHWGLAPRWMDLISHDRVVAYCLPQGQMTHWYRSMAAGLPGHLTQIGIGTFIDPRQDGGKMNERTRSEPDLVHVVQLRGEEYLFIEAVPVHVVIIRGTVADTVGNLSAREEAMKLELLPAVFAARRFDGTVMAQVKALVPRGTLNPRQVEVPGAHIHYITVARSPETEHRQTASAAFEPRFSSQGFHRSLREAAVGPLDARRVIGRRATWELRAGAIVNMGTGIPNDVIGPEVLNEGAGDLVTLTVESGVYGGRARGGIDFGIAEYPDALIEHPYQFDFYNGRGVDVTFMGFGEADESGNVNATKLGDRATGAGGFIDITQRARTVVFCGTFTAQGLTVGIKDGRLSVEREGTVPKWVSRVQQVSFNGRRALESGQRVVVVTERAVFALTTRGWQVTEIAPGVDLERDILLQMAFRPLVQDPLPVTSRLVYTDAPMDLSARLLNLEKRQQHE